MLPMLLAAAVNVFAHFLRFLPAAHWQDQSGHVDLAVIVELIHLATLVHDDIMDEAERRRAQPTAERALGKFAQRLFWAIAFLRTR